MADTFDPYHRWLSIPPDEQPPNHYRLLGLKVLEDDADVIDSAADRQMTHVRTFQSGKFAEHSQRILNEISTAKVTLLDPTKKAAYDAPLRAKLDAEKRTKRADRPLAVAQPLAPSAVAAPLPPAAQPPTVAPPAAETTTDPFAHTTTGISSPKFRRQKSMSPAVIVALVGVVLATLAALGAVAVIVRPWESSTTVTENNPPLVVPPPVDNHNPPPVVPPPIEPPVVKPPIKKPPPQDEPEDELPEDDPEDDIPPDDFEEPPLDEPEDEPLAAPERLPVPAKAERDAQQAKVEGIFQTAKAKTPAEKADLAAQLLRTAVETPDDHVAVFVMLNLARELAGDAARTQLAFDAIDLLERQFDFDADPVRILTIAQGAKANIPNDAKQEVVTLGVELANQLAAADKYEDAAKVLNGLVDLARRAREPQVAAVLIEHRRANDALFAAYKAAQGAFTTLKTSPDDPAANLAAGRFHLLVKNDAARGLTHLAKGNDAALAAAAKLELANPQTPEEQEQLADAWWNLAAKDDDKETQKKLQARSMAWYQRAQPGLKGLAAAKADKRLHELADAGVQPADINLDLGIFDDSPTATPKPRRLPTNLLDLVDVDAHKVNQSWTRDGSDVVSPNAYAALLKIPVTIDGGYDATLEFTRTDGHELVGLVLPVGDHYCDVLLSIEGGAYGGISRVRNQDVIVRPSPLSNNERHALRARVVIDGENVAIETAVDGKPFARWQGAASDLSVADVRQLPQPGHLGLYAHEAKVEFHALRLQKLSGSATADDDAVMPRPTRPKTSSATGDVTSDLVAHWKFDEGSGDVAADAVAGLKGDISGATWVNGARGKALRFDGKDDVVVLGNPDALNFDGPMTLAAWVRPIALPPQTTQTDAFIACILAHGYAFEARREMRLSLEHQTGGARWVGTAWHGDASTSAMGAFNLQDLGQWTHIAMTCDGAAWRVYRNGRVIAETETTQSAVAVPDNWGIGAHGRGGNRYFNGDIDEVRFYRRGLSEYDISTLYLGKSAVTPPRVAARPVNLLTKINPKTDSIVGPWEIQNGALRAPIAPHARVRVPVDPGEEYDLELVVEPTRPERSLVVGLVGPSKRKFAATFQSWDGGKFSGLEFLDDKPCFQNETKYDQPVFNDGRNTIVCSVRKTGVRITVNDKQIVDWQGDFARLGIDRNWDIADNPGLFVGAYNSGFWIHTLTLTPYEPRRTSTSSAPRDVTRGLVAHWKFDEGQGKVASDSAGESNGEVRGATWVKGVHGGALQFDGKDDLVFIGQPKALDLAGESTVSLFVRPLSQTPARGNYPGVASLVARGFVLNPEREFAVRQLRPVGGGPAYWNLHISDGSHPHVDVDAPAIELEKWVHLAAVYDGSAWKFYTGGKLQATKASEVSTPRFDAGWAIGGHASDPRPFHGEIDDVRIYNRGLSDDEVRQLSQSTSTSASTPRVGTSSPNNLPNNGSGNGASKGLIAHWKFDDAQGAVARDSAGGHHGQVNGAAWTKGFRGRALQFAGAGSVVVENHDALNFDGPITYMLWAKLQHFPPRGRLGNVVSHGRTDQPPRAVLLRMQPHDDVFTYLAGSWAGGDNAGIHTFAPASEADQWVHLAFVADGATARLYRNAALLSVSPTTTAAIKVDAPWVFGNDAYNDRGYDGLLDEIRLYDRGLTAVEIKAIYLADLAAADAVVKRRPQPAAPTATPAEITHASYGVGGSVVDVTSLVRDLYAADPFQPLQPDDRAFGDPAQGQQKQLVVDYRVGRRAEQATIAQGKLAALPPLPDAGLAMSDAAAKFTIVAARYGAGNTWVDVTDEVAARVRFPTDSIKWDFAEFDPWFGVKKHFCVWFDYRGKRYFRAFPHDDTGPLLPPS